MSLNYRDVGQALTEFDRILGESRAALWDDDPTAERTALRAARRVLAELDGYLRDRLGDIHATYPDLPAPDKGLAGGQSTATITTAARTAARTCAFQKM